MKANENATCLPSIGMFIIGKERANYSIAYNACTSIGGDLAHVASDQRTIALSQLLVASTKSSTKERLAYVGLNETVRNEFHTSSAEPLACFYFRAWAAGHPL